MIIFLHHRESIIAKWKKKYIKQNTHLDATPQKANKERMPEGLGNLVRELSRYASPKRV